MYYSLHYLFTAPAELTWFTLVIIIMYAFISKLDFSFSLNCLRELIHYPY